MNNPFLDAVVQHVDHVLARCQDRYGSEHSPLLVDFYNPGAGEPGHWQQVLHSRAGSEFGPLRIPANFALQQCFVRALHGLAELTGQQRYSAFADQYVEHALSVLQDSNSGLLYWGGHATYDAERNEPVVGCHELKCAYPDYGALYRVDPARTQFFVEGFWERHVHDWSTLLFNRHGAYAGKKLRAGTEGFWDRTFLGGDLPIIENESLSFINTGSDLIQAGALLSSLSGDPAPGQWARRLLSQFDRIRHPDTQLGGYQLNHTQPCRGRVSLKPPLNQRADIDETTVLRNVAILMRYGRVAVTLLNLADEIGPEDGQEFVDFVHRDLSALKQHACDASTRCFLPVNNDGRRITPDDCADGAGYFKPAGFAPLQPNGLMFLAYAMAYRVTGDATFRDVALGQAEGMGWSIQRHDGTYHVDVEGSNPDPVPTPDYVENRAAAAENDITCLLAWLELARADDRRDLVDVAARWGETLLKRYFRDGFFFDCEAEGDKQSSIGIELAQFVRVGNALPLALLHLVCAIEQKPAKLPRFYPNLHDFEGLKNYHPETGYPGQPDPAGEATTHLHK